MPVDTARLGRWCMASVAVHYMGAAAALDNGNGIPMFVEPQIPRTTENQRRYYELRLDGPHINNVSGNCWKVSGDVNILCTVPQTQDTYSIYDLTGPMQAAMVDIPLLRCGPDNPPDDDTQFGCWFVQFSKREEIKGTMMGRIEPTTPIVQAMVSGSYETTLKNLI